MSTECIKQLLEDYQSKFNKTMFSLDQDGIFHFIFEKSTDLSASALLDIIKTAERREEMEKGGISITMDDEIVEFIRGSDYRPMILQSPIEIIIIPGKFLPMHHDALKSKGFKPADVGLMISLIKHINPYLIRLMGFQGLCSPFGLRNKKGQDVEITISALMTFSFDRSVIKTSNHCHNISNGFIFVKDDHR